MDADSTPRQYRFNTLDSEKLLEILSEIDAALRTAHWNTDLSTISSQVDEHLRTDDLHAAWIKHEVGLEDAPSKEQMLQYSKTLGWLLAKAEHYERARRDYETALGNLARELGNYHRHTEKIIPEAYRGSRYTD